MLNINKSKYTVLYLKIKIEADASKYTKVLMMQCPPFWLFKFWCVVVLQYAYFFMEQHFLHKVLHMFYDVDSIVKTTLKVRLGYLDKPTINSIRYIGTF